MEYSKVLQKILDIAEEMLVSGAEVYRVEDTIKRLCEAYGFSPDRTNAFIIMSNIQVTAEAPDGQILTQIRQVVRSEINYDRLDYLNDLSRTLCKEKCGIEEMEEKYEEVMARPKNPFWLYVAGNMLAAAGFSIFFKGSFADGLAAALIGAVITVLGNQISKYDNNQLAKTFALSVAGGFLAMLAGLAGLNIDKIMIGCIVLLIPGIVLMNAIRDMLIGDLASGLLRFVNSLLLAGTIAFGFAIPMVVLGGGFISAHSSGILMAGEHWRDYILPVGSAFVGSYGFALFFNMKGKQVIYAAVAAALTWGVYLAVTEYISDGVFMPNLISSIFVALLADRLAVINRAPATIFLTAAAVPLIPGGALYYSMAALVAGSIPDFTASAYNCLAAVLAISLGFAAVTIMNKYMMIAKRRRRAKREGAM